MLIMKSMFKNKKVLIVVFALVLTTTIHANNGRYYSPPPPPGLPVDSVPIDGGLVILLAGATAFGVKKLRDKKA